MAPMPIAPGLAVVWDPPSSTMLSVELQANHQVSQEEQHFFINSKVGSRTTQFDAQTHTHTHTAGVS